MPGASQSLHDTLLDYGHYFWYNIKAGECPAIGGHLANTFEDYKNDYIPELYHENFELNYGFFFPYTTARKSIMYDIPIILIMGSYHYSAGPVSGNNTYHSVVAYGFNGDMFKTHFGWKPQSTSFTEVYVSCVTLVDYFSIKYIGEHKHSNNAKIVHYHTDFYICGCGLVPHKSGGGGGGSSHC